MPSERIQRKIEALLDEIDLAAGELKWDRVRELCDGVLRLDPSNEDARAFLEAAGRDTGIRSTIHATDGKPAAGDAPSSAPALSRQPAGTQPPVAPLPSSFASGRYAVKKKLGEGGKKKVYLAHDTVLDRDVAFALIKTAGLDEIATERITREAQAMGRLGDHPNIVPIFDLGMERMAAESPLPPGEGEGEGQSHPYMVLPLMSGGDVEGLIEKAPDHKLPLDRVLEVAKDTARGLLFAHSRGIVHRDLKPGNVWLTSEGTARIGDFGLAIATDRSRLTREGMMVGTVSYMPPEQAMGGEITPRADLYSFGAMLYEMVTGRPPFLGDDDIAIIGQHINTPPVAPTWHRPDCPRTLDSLIMRLLAKDPKQRPESAKDVLAALEGVALSSVTIPAKAGIQLRAAGTQTSSRPTHGRQESDLGTTGAHLDPSLRWDGDTRWDGSTQKDAAPTDAPRSLDSMSSGVFVGRQKEMDQLRAALEETLSGHGRMVTLVGEPGIGKTRTAQELATYAGLRRCQVLWGRCYEGGGAPPYWPWVQAIRQFVNEKDHSEVKSAMSSSASVIAEVVPDVKEKLPGINPPPALESPESARFRLFDSVTSFLKNASRHQAIVLVLDDLHWSDKPSLLLLEFVARELGNSRVLLVGTYRDMELNRKHPLSVSLGDLTRERLFERVLLRGLQKEDVDRFIEIAAGVKAPSGLTDAVFTQTEGNPLFVTEVVRLLVQEGHLRHPQPQVPRSARDDGRGSTSSWNVRIPEGVKEVIGRRLDRLSDRCNDVLTTAAVIGRRFALSALVKLYSDQKLSPEEKLSEDRLLELMEEALAARIIEELPSGPGRYQFTHALMQETLTSELSTTRKVRLHARIALALEELYGARAEERAAELAQHFAEAESLLGPDKLVKYSLMAGQRALAAFGYEEALQHFQKGLAAVQGKPMDVVQARLYWGLGRAQAATLGRLQQQTSVNSLKRAADYFLATGDIESAVGVVESLPVVVGGGGSAGTDNTSVIEEVMRKVQPGTQHEASLLTSYIEAVGVERGDVAKADHAHRRVSEWLAKHPDPRIELRAAAALLQTNSHNSRNEGRMALAQRVLDMAKQQGDMVTQCKAYLFLAGGRMGEGDSKGAELLAQEFLAVAENLKSVHELEDALAVLSRVAILQGQWDRSKAYLERALAMSPDHPLFFGALFTIDLYLGNHEASQKWLEKAKSLAKASSLGASHPYLAMIGMTALSAYVTGSHAEIPATETAARDILALPTVSIGRQRGIRLALGLMAVVREDRESCQNVYSMAKGWGSSFAYVHTERLFGLLAKTFGNLELARQHFEKAIRFLERANFRVDLAWAHYEMATVLEQSSEGKERASSHYDEALKLARDLGMKPLIERILKRRQLLKA